MTFCVLSCLHQRISNSKVRLRVVGTSLSELLVSPPFCKVREMPLVDAHGCFRNSRSSSETVDPCLALQLCKDIGEQGAELPSFGSAREWGLLSVHWSLLSMVL